MLIRWLNKMLSKAQQLRKNGKMRDNKRLSDNAEYRKWLSYNIKVCQICRIRPTEDAHHLSYGCYGADKNDATQICVCRVCHEWCHRTKRLSQERYMHIAEDNYKNYLAQCNKI